MLSVCLITVLIGSFAEAQQEHATQALKERAKTLWNARVAGDWATVYNLLPVEETSEMTKEAFVAQRKEKDPFRYLSTKLGEAAVAGAMGWVELEYDVQLKDYPQAPPRHMQTWSVWFVKNGQWYPMTKEQREQAPKLPPQKRPADEEARLSSRAQEFWKAREGRDWALTYQFLKPEYRAQVPVEQFLPSDRPPSYLSHRLEWTEVNGEHGRVKVAFTYELKEPESPKPGPQENSIIEDWVKTDGQWYRHKPWP